MLDLLGGGCTPEIIFTVYVEQGWQIKKSINLMMNNLSNRKLWYKWKITPAGEWKFVILIELLGPL